MGRIRIKKFKFTTQTLLRNLDNDLSCSVQEPRRTEASAKSTYGNGLSDLADSFSMIVDDLDDGLGIELEHHASDLSDTLGVDLVDEGEESLTKSVTAVVGVHTTDGFHGDGGELAHLGIRTGQGRIQPC